MKIPNPNPLTRCTKLAPVQKTINRMMAVVVIAAAKLSAKIEKLVLEYYCFKQKRPYCKAWALLLYAAEEY
jgi:hypothetical protein